jgi:hypothetical protein
MVAEGRIIVHPRCKQLAGCLEFGVWDEKRRKFERTETLGHFDALAALIYLVRNLDVHTNPIPRDYKFDRMNQLMFNRDTQTQATLKRAFGIK